MNYSWCKLILSYFLSPFLDDFLSHILNLFLCFFTKLWYLLLLLSSFLWLLIFLYFLLLFYDSIAIYNHFLSSNFFPLLFAILFDYEQFYEDYLLLFILLLILFPYALIEKGNESYISFQKQILAALSQTQNRDPFQLLFLCPRRQGGKDDTDSKTPARYLRRSWTGWCHGKKGTTLIK